MMRAARYSNSWAYNFLLACFLCFFTTNWVSAAVVLDPGMVSFGSRTHSFSEDVGNTSIIIQRSGGRDGRITVSLAVRTPGNPAATEGEDFRITSKRITWESGESGNKSVALEIFKDSLTEGDERFDLVIENLGGAEAGKITSTQITIEDVAPSKPGLLNLDSASYRVRENAGSIDIGVTRSDGNEGIAEVNYSVVTDKNDTATEGKDYTRISGTLSWKNGESGTKTFSVKVLTDALQENDETATIQIFRSTGASIGQTSRASLIIEDVPPEKPGQIQFDRSAYTFSESDKTAKLTLKRINGSDGEVEAFIGFGAAGDSAKNGEDYTPPGTKTVRWADGDNANKTISVALKEDNIVEKDEVFTVFLDDTSGAEPVSPDSAKVTIKDSTRPGVINFKTVSHTSAENAGDISIEVIRTDGSDGAASVKYTIGSDGDTATADADYKSGSGTLNWADGDTSAKRITLSLIADQIKEPDETVSIFLSSPSGASLGDKNNTRITIKDASSEGFLSFSSATYSVKESEGGATIIVRRSGGSAGAVSVKVVSGGEGDTADNADYTALEQTLNWPEGDSSDKTVQLVVNEDDEFEPDETLSLRLIQASNGAEIIEPDMATVTIVNTTAPRSGNIEVESASYAVTETDGTVQIRVLRVGGTDNAVSVNYTLGADGDTAVAGNDYVDDSGVLNWPQGDGEARTIDISLISNAAAEPSKVLTLVLSDPTGGASLGANSSARITIADQIPETSSPVLDIISGDQQSGFPGDMLEPFVLSVTVGSVTAAGQAVNWIVEPASAGRLVQGLVTESDDSGLAENTLEILEGGVISVTAVVETESAGNQTATRANGSEPNRVSFTVNAGFAGAPDLTPNQRAVGGALDKACAALQTRDQLSAGQTDLLNTCNQLQSEDNEGIKSGLNRLQPEELFAIGTLSIDTADLQVTNVQSRINAIRAGRRGVDLSSLQLQLYGQNIPSNVSGVVTDLIGGGGGAGEEDDFSKRLGVFVNGTLSVGELEKSENEMGLDFDSQAITAGIDYRVDDSFVIGGSLGLVSHKGDYSTEGGNIEMSSTSLSAFATWYYEDKGYLDAIVHYGSSSFDIKRRINLQGQADQFAIGKPDATELAFSLGAGLEYMRDEWTYGPYARLSFTKTDVDAYDETASNTQVAGFGSVLSIKSQTVDNSLIALGGHVSKAINTSTAVFLPQARLELEHRLKDDAREIEASFSHDPESSLFEIKSDKVDTDYINLGLGGSAIFRNGKTAFLFYETRLGQDRLDQHWFKAGLRFEF